MALGRRVVFAAALGSLFYSGVAPALGMGDITLQSALNQPLNAEIDLLDVGDLSAQDIRVALASSNDFARVGVDRVAFLQDLRFIPLIEGNHSRIRVVSDKPVREPYLNFLVEITRANSRLLREYTVLLDPMPSQPVRVRESGVSEQPIVEPPRAESPRFETPTELPSSSQGKLHRVASGESLWMIANAYTGNGSKGDQSRLMRDIHALNPDAFAGGEAAHLKAGARLLLPDTADVPVTARAGSVRAKPPLEVVVEPEPAPVDSMRLDDQLATLRQQFAEELASSRDENRQLRQMLTDMQYQLETVTSQLAEQARSQAGASSQVVGLVRPTEAAQPPAVDSVAVSVAMAEPASPFTWQSWAMVGGAVLMLVALCGLWVARRHKSKLTEPSMEAAACLLRVPEAVATATVDMPRQPAKAFVSETDVLEAADLYLTYGRRDEALDVLQRGIERTPEQLDLRLRHLGLLAESGETEGYSRAADEYLQAGGSKMQLDQLQALHPALAATVAATIPSTEMLDPDVTFVLDDLSDATAHLVPETDENPRADGDQALTAQPLLDAFDDVFTLGSLPSLIGDSAVFEPGPTAEEIRQLEPNPEHLVRLNQAAAYIKQGDIESACVILETLAIEGDEQQRQQVNELLAQIV
ncbi:FimV/HubP family polar landmark protein [Stutzerimonas chloritidismutans]|uniref:FimV/HubP family polar landmark protein n=1 Tax=Stutzerimonas chloritidismutans TaxID=203192 RepID=UPI00384FF0C9